MKQIQIDLNRFQKPAVKEKPLSERAFLLKEFLERLNAERDPKYKPLTPSRIGMMLRFIKTKDLYPFLAELKQSSHFSKSFWWRMNPKNYEQTETAGNDA